MDLYDLLVIGGRDPGSPSISVVGNPVAGAPWCPDKFFGGDSPWIAAIAMHETELFFYMHEDFCWDEKVFGGDQ